MANIWRKELPHKPGHFVEASFQSLLFFPLSFLLFPFSPRCLSLRPSFLLFSPSLCPISPFLPALQKAGAWALALNFDLACNQSYPWALPSSQTRDSSLPPTPLPSSISCSLFVPIFFSLSFLRSLWILNGHTGFWWGVGRRDNRE